MSDRAVANGLRQMRDVFQAVRRENIAGRAYPRPDDETVRLLLDSLVECGLVTEVVPTPLSLGGYVAHGLCGIASASGVKGLQA